MMETKPHTGNPICASIGRQPVFDDNKRLWGYELFCVGSAGMAGSGFPGDVDVAITGQSSAYICLQQITEREKKVIVNFSEKSILENLPHALPPVLTAVKVAENAGKDPRTVDSLARLKAEGYLIAVGGFTGDPECEPLYRLADIAAIDAAGVIREALSAGVARVRSFKAMPMASGVEDPKRFGICQDLGFSLFQGAFFKSPDRVAVRKLSSNEILRFNLLQAIEKDDADIAGLAKAIQADPTISFRLLAYLNSAAFAFSHKIKSIHQAISLLGWQKLRNWLRVVLLSDVSENKEAHELVLLSAQRGLFLELVARDHDFWGFSPESLHLLGIFSLLDALLAMPMPEVVQYLPLDKKIKAALCRETNNEYLPLLELAQQLEEARWEEGDKLIQQLGLDAGKVKAALQAALNWASELDSMRSPAAHKTKMGG
jgi:EAL and modified HD-GYP domain-containing signal transduction protein